MIRGITVLMVIALLMMLSGCAGSREKLQFEKGPTFNTRGTTEALSPDPAPETANRNPEPIVRIIKGMNGENPDWAEAVEEEEKAIRGLETPLDSIVLRDVDVRTISELLTEISGSNVVATHAVAGLPVNIYLQNLTIRGALEAICRLNDLWYREIAGIITLMTREEYVRDIEVRKNDQTRAFYIRYTNAADMAKVIQAAMGEEVYLSVIENEKIYGHIDPEGRAEIGDGKYDITLPPVAKEAIGSARQTKSGEGGSPAPVSNPAVQRPLQAGTAPAAASGTPSEKKQPIMAILTVFKRNNCIVARSLDQELLNEMARIIEALDTPTSQVLLEIRILQLTLDDGFESFFDFEWSDPKNYLGVLGSKLPGTTTLNYLFGDDRIASRIAFFEKEGRAEIIATPFLMSANNSSVEFFVGEDTPLRDDVTTSTVPVGDQGDTITTFKVNIIREELGTDVKMTTFINEDATVTLEFEAEISSPILNYSSVTVFNDTTGEAVQFPLDATSKSEIKSILSARSGESIAIGGIIKETLDLNENKVPVLGDIPLLGFFFKEVNNTRKKTETVIVLTPHVIMHPAAAEKTSRKFLERKSSHEQITEGKDNILENRKK